MLIRSITTILRCLGLSLALAACGALEVGIERPASINGGPETQPPCQISDSSRLSGSPDGKFAVAHDTSSPSTVVIIAYEDAKCDTLTWRKPVELDGWTADSRFALFSVKDQYGNAWPDVFDTQAWEQRSLPGPDQPADMSGTFRNGVVAIAPATSRVILGMGAIVYLPDATAGNALATIGKNYVEAAAWSPDESRLAFVAYSSREGEDATLYIADGSAADAQPVTGVDFVALGSLTLAWTADGAIVVLKTMNADYLVDIATGAVRVTGARSTPEPLPPLPKPTRTLVRGENFTQVAVHVHDLASSPDGGMIAIASNDWGVHLVARESLTDIAFLPASTETSAVAYSPNGQLIAASGVAGDLWVWEADTGQLRLSLHAHTSEVRRIAFSSDSQFLVSAGHDGSVRLWEIASGQAVRDFAEHAHEMLAVAFSPDGELVAAGGHDGSLYVWQVGTGELVRKIEGAPNEWVRSLAFSPNGTTLASASDRINLWDIASGQLRLTIASDPQPTWVCCVAFAPDGRLLAAPQQANVVGLYDASNGELQQTLEGHAALVTSLGFTADGQYLVSGDYDGIIRLWSVR